MEVRRIPLYQSLHRHNLVLGAERELAMGSSLIALLVGSGVTFFSGVSAFAFWLVSMFLLQRMAKADPLMSKVWMRHVKQQVFYSARSSRWRPLEGFKAR
ncbi:MULTISPECIES: conjugal transfer protein TrbD [Desulfovibrio]|uniref:Type IV secretion system protein VirB3 n=2 Tax=Desulfovibrio TaxID=872 RepID=A0AA94L2K4_DESDE|nr:MULTISPECIES: conjugal transfer protein TrbD [Desulfovibrio]ATD82333.1 conjugal transfer protein TrbD [Desulfovibrio sp. G11]SFW55445.1 type IV secretion system protein VirB3 [Desulfovibrio desulfuricans]SPD35106.1 Conjugal transfer protein, TrbD [Desulfovibrio sp. G11]